MPRSPRCGRCPGAIRKMKPPPAPDRVIALTVVDRQVVAHDQDVVALTLAAADGRPCRAGIPAHTSTSQLPSGRLRQYSLCGDPDDDRTPTGSRCAGSSTAAADRSRCTTGCPSAATVTTHGPRNAFPLTVPGYGSPDAAVPVHRGRHRHHADSADAGARRSVSAWTGRWCTPAAASTACRSSTRSSRFGDRVEIRTDDVSGRADRGGTARRLHRRHNRVRVRTRADVDGDPRGAGRARQRRAAFRTVRRATGRRRPGVLGVDRVDGPGGRRRRRRDACWRRCGGADVAAPYSCQQGLLRHVPDAGGVPAPSTTATRC